jgi:YfiH family protein
MKVKYHFFGKDCIINRALSERDEINESMTRKGFVADALLFVSQVHGADVVVVDEQSKIYGNQNLPKADAIVTNLKNIAVGIITADCSPILLFDENQGIVAAAHAGWRGARSGLIESVVMAMKNLGAKNISAKIGPMIQQKSYEVSADFLADFLVENSQNKDYFEIGLHPDKYRFNLPAYVESKLRNSGVEMIENINLDTYENEEKYFSFRRSNHRGEKDCGRNISVIVLNLN